MEEIENQYFRWLKLCAFNLKHLLKRCIHFQESSICILPFFSHLRKVNPAHSEVSNISMLTALRTSTHQAFQLVISFHHIPTRFGTWQRKKYYFFSGKVLRPCSCRAMSASRASRDGRWSCAETETPSTPQYFTSLMATIRCRISEYLHWKYQDTDCSRKIRTDMFMLGSAAKLPKNGKEHLRPSH